MKHLVGLALICLLVNVALSQDRSHSRHISRPSEDYDYDNRSPPEAETPPPRRQQSRRLRQPSSQSQTPPEKQTFSRGSSHGSPAPQQIYREAPSRTYREQALPHSTGPEASHQDSSSLRLRQQSGPFESTVVDEAPYQVTRRQLESSTIPPERTSRRRRPAKRRRPQKVEEADEIDPEKSIRSHGHQRTRPEISSLLDNDPHRSEVPQPDIRPSYNEGSRRVPQSLPHGVHAIPVNIDENNEQSRHHPPQNSPLSGDPDEHDLPPHVRQPLLQHQPGNRLPLEHSEAPRDYPSSNPSSYEEPKLPESFPRPQQESLSHPIQPFTPDQSSNRGDGYHPVDLPLHVAPHSNSQNELPIPPPPGRYESPVSDRYNPTEDKRDYSSYRELNLNSQRDPIEKRPTIHPNQSPHRQSPESRDKIINRNTQSPPDTEIHRQRSSRPTRIATRVVRVQGPRVRGSDNERVYEVSAPRRHPEVSHRTSGRRIQTSVDSEVRLPPQEQPILAPEISSPNSRTEIPRDRRIEESIPGYPIPSNRLPEPEKIRYEPKQAHFSYTTGDIDQYHHPLRPDHEPGTPTLPGRVVSDVPSHEPVHDEPVRKPLNRLPHENDDEEIRDVPQLRTQTRSNARTHQRDQDSGYRETAPSRTRSHDSSLRVENSRQQAASQRAGTRYQGSNPPEESLSETLRTVPRQDESQRSRSQRYRSEGSGSETQRDVPRQDESQRSRSHGYRSRPQYEGDTEERASGSSDLRHAPVNSRSSSRSTQRQPSPSSASSVRRENISPRSQNHYDDAPSQHQPRISARQEQAPPRSSSRFQCPEPYGFFPDSQQCDKYYECHNGTAVESLCMDGLAFNLVSSPKYLRCDSLRDVDCNSRPELQPARPSKNCPRRFGLYPHESDCTKFWNCVDGTATEVQCPPGLVYHDTKATCDWADLVTGSCKTEDLLGFTCPEATAHDLQDGVYGRYPHPSDCRLHFICIKGDDGLRRPRMLSCNEGFVFDPSGAQCTRPESVAGCEEYYGPPVVKKKPSRNQQQAREEVEEVEEVEQPSSGSRRRRPNRRTQGRYEA